MIICLILYLLIMLLYVLYRKDIISIKTKKSVLRKVSILFIIILTIASLLEIGNLFSDHTVKKIQRNDYEEGTKTGTYKVGIGKDAEEILDIPISARTYTELELQKLYTNAVEELKVQFLGENDSPGHITEKLNLMERIDGYPFQIRWELSRYDVVDSMGNIHQDILEKVDAGHEGVQVNLTAVLQYETKSFSFFQEITVYAGKESAVSDREKLQKVLAELDDQNREDAYVELPETLDGKNLVWKKAEKTKTIPLLMLGSALSMFLLYSERQKELDEQKKREKQMLFDYPEIVSQFTVLIGAGMSTKNAWKKIVEDYGKQKARTGRVRWAYEEMIVSLQEMQSGIPEIESYIHFTERTNVMPYRKLGALLVQNLRKGTKGMWAMLEVEASQSLEERKNQVKKLSEEAGTKMLLPMLMMLIVVLMIVMVPAFVSIQV